MSKRNTLLTALKKAHDALPEHQEETLETKVLKSLVANLWAYVGEKPHFDSLSDFNAARGCNFAVGASLIDEPRSQNSIIERCTRAATRSRQLVKAVASSHELSAINELYSEWKHGFDLCALVVPRGRDVGGKTNWNVLVRLPTWNCIHLLMPTQHVAFVDEPAPQQDDRMIGTLSCAVFDKCVVATLTYDQFTTCELFTVNRRTSD